MRWSLHQLQLDRAEPGADGGLRRDPRPQGRCLRRGGRVCTWQCGGRDAGNEQGTRHGTRDLVKKPLPPLTADSLLFSVVHRRWKSFGSMTSPRPSLPQAGCMRATKTRPSSARIRTSETNPAIDALTHASILFNRYPSPWQVLGPSVRLPLHPSDGLAAPLRLLLLPGLWEGCLLEGTGTGGGTSATKGRCCALKLLLKELCIMPVKITHFVG